MINEPEIPVFVKVNFSGCKETSSTLRYGTMNAFYYRLQAANTSLSNQKQPQPIFPPSAASKYGRFFEGRGKEDNEKSGHTDGTHRYAQRGRHTLRKRSIAAGSKGRRVWVSITPFADAITHEERSGSALTPEKG